MKKAHKLWIFIFVIVAVSYFTSRAYAADEESSPNEEVTSLLKTFSSSDVSKIDVLMIEPGTLTRTGVTPATLEKWFDYRLTVNRFQSTKYAHEMAKAIAGLKMSNEQSIFQEAFYSTKGDVRWGIIFYRSDGSRIGGLYFDAIGSHGLVDDVNVSFGNGSKMVKWLADHFFKEMNQVLDCAWEPPFELPDKTKAH